MSTHSEVRYPHAPRTAARVGGTLLLIGGSLAVILMAVGPGFVHGKTEPTLFVASIAIGIGLLCVIWPGRVPGWFLPMIGPLGTVLIAMSSILTRTTTDGSELLYMWTVLFSGYFMPMRFALLNIGLIALVYPAIAISIMGRLGITPSVYLVGTSIVTMLIVASLRNQIARVITETAREARTDKLTGLANRRSWEEGLAHEIARQRRQQGPLSALVIDLDHFKRLNDTYGHAAGDLALAGVADILRSHARQSDVLARVGGEEFNLLLPDCAPGDARHRAEEIRIAVERIAAEWATPVTVSIGVASLPVHARAAGELMEAADVALYEAKRAGRNTVRVYKVEGPPAVPDATAWSKADPRP
jgi:diguanylate cyclase (GGDEF)-like protein